VPRMRRLRPDAACLRRCRLPDRLWQRSRQLHGRGLRNGRCDAGRRTHRTYTSGTTPLASMLTIPVPRRPSAMRAWGLVLTPLGAGLAVLLSIAPRSQQAHPGALWASVVAGLFLSAAVWLPGVIFTIAGHSRLRTYTREAPLRELTWRVWASASYCARDHVVFLPDGTHAAPGLARSMMYNAARQALPTVSNLR
jgi:hypothetical protein